MKMNRFKGAQNLASEVAHYWQQPSGRWGPDTQILARACAGSKETWEQTNQLQLLWHLLKENICPRALWDKVSPKSTLVCDCITHLFPGHVIHKWGDREDFTVCTNCSRFMAWPPMPACKQLHCVALGADAQERPTSVKVISLIGTWATTVFKYLQI